MTEKTVIKSTSASSAQCSDIVVRSKETTRLVFRPELVDNPTNARAAVRGTFIYQRKGRAEDWTDTDTIPLSGLKKGEGYKLELHAAELLDLMKQLVELYRLHSREGIPLGETELVRADSLVARVLKVPTPELRKYLEANAAMGGELLTRLLAWAVESDDPSGLAARLLTLGDGPLRKLSVAAGIGALRRVLEIWEHNQDRRDEEFWQRVLAEHSILLEQLFAWPVTIVKEKAYVGGKSVMDAGGKLVDFLLRHPFTSNAALVEIKTPATQLVGAPYRSGIFNVSSELSGSVLQVLSYRQQLQQELYNLQRGLPESLHAFEPHCLVIIGHTRELGSNEDRTRSFELFRAQSGIVTIVTFDELFARTRRLLELLEGST